MERGLEQLFLLAAVLLAALFDLVVRWVRRAGRPPHASGMAVDASRPGEAGGAAPPGADGWRFPEERGAATVRSGGAAPRRRVETPRIDDTASGRRVARSVEAARLRPAAVRSSEAAPRRRLRNDPGVLREAIVLMAILGPCRAIDPPRGEAP